jgi:O-antigen ligase
MFALPGLVALVFFIYVRPQEFVTWLAKTPLLYGALGLAVFGAVLDVRLRMSRLAVTPQLRWVIAFYLWCLFTLLLRAPREIAAILQLSIAVSLFFVLSHAVQTFKSFQVVAATLLGVGLFVAAVCVHQGTSDFGCVRYVEESEKSTGVHDGRPCELPEDCMRGDAEPGASYICEHIGLFGTSSIARGRVRYRGVLQDPNEVALAVSIAMPIAFAFRERKPSLLRTVLLVFTLVLVGVCAVMTQSRGGQLVFASVVGAYFVKKYGLRGALVGAVLALPLLLLGGRSDVEADASSTERVECWYEALEMFRRSPVFGVGYDQFTEHHFLTAHSSFLLPTAELGMVGLFAFTAIMYLSVKVPIVALGRYGDAPEAKVAKTWSMALLAMVCGLLVGAFFLSFTYHFVLWIHVGLVGAFYGCVRSHDPEFEVRFSLRDLGLLLLVDLGLLFLLFVYTRLKL